MIHLQIRGLHILNMYNNTEDWPKNGQMKIIYMYSREKKTYGDTIYYIFNTFKNNEERSHTSLGYNARGPVLNVALWYSVTMSSGETTKRENLVHSSVATLPYTASHIIR